MNLIESLLSFISNPTHTLSSKFTIFLIGLSLCLLINDITGFTMYYNMDRKIDEIQKISSILNTSTNDSITKSYAIGLRDNLVNRENIVDGISEAFVITNSVAFWNFSKKNDILFWLSCTFVLIFVFLRDSVKILLNPNKTLIYKGSEIIVSLGVSFFFSLLIVWLSRFIPKLSQKTWLWNYLINIVLWSSLLIFSKKSSAISKTQ